MGVKIVLHANTNDQRIAALASLAIAIHVVEANVPSPLPGVKPGLANVVTLATLTRYGWRAAVWVGLLRVSVGALITGSFLSPGFILSTAGAVGSLAILGIMRKLPGISVMGLSVVAALTHSASQVGVAYMWLIPHPGLLRLLPVLLTMALLFGLVSGKITLTLLNRVQLRQL